MGWSVCWIYYSVCCLIACGTFAIGTRRGRTSNAKPLMQFYNGIVFVCSAEPESDTTIPMPNEPHRDRFIVHFFRSSIFRFVVATWKWLYFRFYRSHSRTFCTILSRNEVKIAPSRRQRHCSTIVETMGKSKWEKWLLLWLWFTVYLQKDINRNTDWDALAFTN